MGASQSTASPLVRRPREEGGGKGALLIVRASGLLRKSTFAQLQPSGHLTDLEEIKLGLTSAAMASICLKEAQKRFNKCVSRMQFGSAKREKNK